MPMMITHKLGDVAKDLNIQTKDLIETVATLTGETKKQTASLTEQEMNRLFEHYTNASAVESLDAYLASAPAPKAAEAPVKQPQKAQPTQESQPKKPENAHVAAGPVKRKERIRPEKPEKENKPEQPKREVVMVTVDTRPVDVNLDKFNEKYTSLAATKNVENRRKPTPVGNKQKFGN
ncbi:MAG: translation initiation factor IF-2 N-terminal domain-containing protein, partial [Ruthenibacterium sp.]